MFVYRDEPLETCRVINLPIAVEALWDALADGLSAEDAIKLISFEYEVDSRLLTRTFEKRYDQSQKK